MNLGLLNVFLPLFIFGVATAFLGAIKLSLAERLVLNDAHIANFVILAPIANLVGTLIAGYWLVGISYQFVLLGGYLLIINALILFSQVKKPYLLTPAIISLGLGGAWLNLGSNALLPVISPNNTASITNFAHACFGLGALSLPIIFSALLRRFSWTHSIYFLTGIVLFPLLLAIIIPYPSSSGAMMGEVGLDLLLHPTLKIALLISLCYVGIEMAIALWTTTYLKYIGWEPLTASSLVSLFWLGLTGGRLLTSLLITPYNSHWFFQGAIAILWITLLMMTLWLKKGFGVLGIAVLGLSCASIFPTLIAALFTQFDPRFSGTIYALMSVSGVMGSAAFPYLLGQVSNQFSIIRSFQFLLVPTTCLLFLSLRLG